MLLRKELVIKDPCQVSVDILRHRALVFLKKKVKAKHVWFADHYKEMPEARPGEVVDVVFFGSFVRRFLESGNWPEGRYRFWCLTGSVKSAIASLLLVPKTAVGVIPREEIFAPPKKVAKLPKSDHAMTFVFGGRLSATKNLELLVRVVNRLQLGHGLDVSLVLSGDFDDRNHPDRGIWEGERYSEKLKSLISSLEWKSKPLFKHRLGPNNWTEQAYVNPVYVNLSTYLYEDFDVSLAQARARGWPAIVSDWGGHRDVVESESVMKIHPAMIGHSHEATELTRLRAEAIAIWIDARLSRKAVFESEVAPRASYVEPEVVSSRAIDESRRKFLRLLGPGGLTLQRRGLDGFSYEDASEKFFASYRACFAAPLRGSAVAVLVNDLHASDVRSVAEIPHVCEAIMRDPSRAKSQIVLVPVNEALHPMHAFVFARAKEILVPFESRHLAPLVRHWREDLEVPGKILAVSRGRGKRALAFQKLK